MLVPRSNERSNVRILELELLEKGLHYCCSVRGLMRGRGGSAAGNGSLRKARLESQKVRCVRIVMLRTLFLFQNIHTTPRNVLQMRKYMKQV